MRFPWRRKQEPAVSVRMETPEAAAQRFWEQWRELLPEVSSALGEGQPNQVEHQLCEVVAQLHPRLHFALERGQRSIYALLITAQEDPALRPYTDAWKAAAPPDDAIWEYHDSVPPVPDTDEVTVNLGPHRIRLAEVRVVAQVDRDVNGDVVDVAVYHPVMAELDEAARRVMTFLPLDAALGERVAGERLRRVETAVTEPAETISLGELRTLVTRLASANSGGDVVADD